MSDADEMEFQNWLHSRHISVNWVTVAQSTKCRNSNSETDFFITSVLAETDSTKHLLVDYKWLAKNDFGNSVVWENNGKLCYDENSVIELRNIRIEPFVIYRTWHNKETSRLELIQNFILFYNLFFDKKENTYKALSDTGEETNVIKISNEECDKKIEIRVCFLRNYLAFKNQILVRQHHHYVHSSKTLEEFGIRADQRLIKKSEYSFNLAIGEHGATSNFRSYSMLVGKDLLLPFERRRNLLEWSKEYCEFIIGVNNQGESIKSTCEEESMTTNYTTSVFFKRDVLKKYYDMPSKYIVDSTSLSCGNSWEIPIDINNEDLVQVYLGDLSCLPYMEQLHWQSYNVPPEGGITKSRLARDVYAQFAEPEDVIFQFKKSLEIFQARFEDRFGFRAFMPLKPSDASADQCIRVPLNDEVNEFEQQIAYLAKMLPDSIDTKAIMKKAADIESVKNESDRKNFMLKAFLEYHSLNTTIFDSLVEIQEIRSAGVAHRKGSKYKKIVQKYNLEEFTYAEFFKKLIVCITKSLDDLYSSL